MSAGLFASVVLWLVATLLVTAACSYGAEWWCRYRERRRAR